MRPICGPISCPCLRIWPGMLPPIGRRLWGSLRARPCDKRLQCLASEEPHASLGAWLVEARGMSVGVSHLLFRFWASPGKAPSKVQRGGSFDDQYPFLDHTTPRQLASSPPVELERLPSWRLLCNSS